MLCKVFHNPTLRNNNLFNNNWFEIIQEYSNIERCEMSVVSIIFGFIYALMMVSATLSDLLELLLWLLVLAEKGLAVIGGLWSPNTKTYENIICLNTIALRVLIYLYMQLYIPLLIFSISFVIFKISSIRIDFLSTLFTIYSWFFKALFVNFTCLFA